jgi:hypothetical protein
MVSYKLAEAVLVTSGINGSPSTVYLKDALEVEGTEDFEGEDDLVLVALVGRGEGVGVVTVIALRSSGLNEWLASEDLRDEVEYAFCDTER